MHQYKTDTTILASSVYHRAGNVTSDATMNFKLKANALINENKDLQVLVEFQFDAKDLNGETEIITEIVYVGIFSSEISTIDKNESENFAKVEATKILYSLIKAHFYDLQLKSQSYNFSLPENYPINSAFTFENS